MLAKKPNGNRFRKLEMKWLSENDAFLREHYAGEWLALDGPRLVAHGKDLMAVIAQAREQGVDNPLLSCVQAREYQGLRLFRRWR